MAWTSKLISLGQHYASLVKSRGPDRPAEAFIPTGLTSFDFKCFCGEEPRRPGLDGMHWATFAGIGTSGSHAWKRDRDAALMDDDRGWLETTPIVGQSYWMTLRNRFSIGAKEPFWTIHESPAAWWSEYDEIPDHIDRLLLVKGFLTDLEHVPHSSGGRDHGIAQMQITETLTIANLLALPLSPHPTTERLGMDWSMYDPMVARSGDLAYIWGNFEGDVGSWALMHDTPEATDLLIRGIWGCHEDVFWAGRVRLRHGDTTIGAGWPFSKTPARPIVASPPRASD